MPGKNKLNLMLVGNAKSGKSSILLKLKQNLSKNEQEAIENIGKKNKSGVVEYTSTIGVDVITVKEQIKKEVQVVKKISASYYNATFQISDTAGEDRYRDSVLPDVSQMDAVVICVSLVNDDLTVKSKEGMTVEIGYWLREIANRCHNNLNLTIILMATKVDLVKKEALDDTINLFKEVCESAANINHKIKSVFISSTKEGNNTKFNCQLTLTKPKVAENSSKQESADEKTIPTFEVIKSTELVTPLKSTWNAIFQTVCQNNAGKLTDQVLLPEFQQLTMTKGNFDSILKDYPTYRNKTLFGLLPVFFYGSTSIRNLYELTNQNALTGATILDALTPSRQQQLNAWVKSGANKDASYASGTEKIIRELYQKMTAAGC